MSFCHLHVHSNFTFGEGTSRVDDLILKAKKMGMKELALTDKEGLYGAVRFYDKATKVGIKPIIGTEVRLESGYSLILLAKSKKGYSNLCHLISEMHLSSEDEPRLKIEILARYSEDLFALSGPKGELGGAILRGRFNLAKKKAHRYLEILGKDHFFIELQNHLLPQERILNEALFNLACQLGLLVLATNNVYYLNQGDYELHQVLVRSSQIVHHRNIRPTPNEEYYLKTPLQMARLFGRYPAALVNASLVAEECNLKLDLGKIVPPAFTLPKGEKAHDALLKQCFKNLPQRFHPPNKKVIRALARELEIIRRKGFSSYFLLVADIVGFAKREGIRCSVRGSASGSLVAYLLGISQVDPLKHSLLFERFLNPERLGLPDIDLDFDSRRRDEVTGYVLKKYSPKVALVATVPTFRARGALREVARAWGLSYERIDSLTHMLPYLSADKIRSCLEILPELKGHELREKLYEDLLDVSEKVDGFPRYLSSHLAGVVISQGSLQDLVPVQKSAKGFPLAQYDKDDLERLGLIKTDLLSLRMLGAISEAVEHLKMRGIDLDLEKIPLDDEKVYKLLRSTKTVGCFQLESPGMRQLLGKLQPRAFSDIVANISLFRPGPMHADMITPFLQRRHGREKVSFLHPALEPILKETYGVIIFQEQVLRIAQDLAGFSLGQADLLRRSMTEKISPEEKERLRAEFLSGCKRKKVEKEIAEKIFGKLASFGAFGFCKAHAVSFAKIAYQSAYLKAYYPREFFLGLLNNEPGLYPPMIILNEAKRLGIKVLAPDINRSEGKFSLEDAALRVGLSRLKEMGPSSLEEILRERRKRKFESLEDFCLRVQIERNLLENLILSGCFNSLNGENTDHLLKVSQIFSQLLQKNGVESVRGILKSLPFSPEKKALLEMNLLALTLGSHPLLIFRKALQKIERVKSSHLSAVAEGEMVKVAGIKVILHTPPTKSGQRVIFLTLEDEDDLIDVTVFPSAQRLYAKDIFEADFLLVEGRVQKHGPAVSIIADKAFDLRKM
ncbi:MAG: DNA polymerase III subunit alpha [bacterium]